MQFYFVRNGKSDNCRLIVKKKQMQTSMALKG